MDATNEQIEVTEDVPSVATDPLDLRGQVREEIRRAGFTQTAAAAKIGFSGATLGRWLANKYGADAAQVEDAVRKWLMMRKEQMHQRVRTTRFIETPTAREITKRLTHAQNYGDLVIVHGQPGASKTITSENFVETHVNVWLATISPATSGLRSALLDICEAIGVPGDGPTRSLFVAICREVKGKDGLLIIDEAQHLDFDALEQIRAIYDRTKVGVALVGNDGLFMQMSTGHKADKLSRLHSRLGGKVCIGKPTRADVDAILDDWKLSGACRKKLHELSSRPGALRTVGKLLNRAAEFADDAGAAMCCEHLDLALAEFQGGAL